MEKTVVKRDGAHEPFDEQKIVRVVRAAGVHEGQAVDLAKSASAWLAKQPGELITSLAIRDVVHERLEQVNKYAANLYRWYQKTKE